uniref:Ovule protein n=1 Tax=Panagrellus redivivus TaxID=6233 RepID=A0A7E4W1L7_PANRE
MILHLDRFDMSYSLQQMYFYFTDYACLVFNLYVTDSCILGPLSNIIASPMRKEQKRLTDSFYWRQPCTFFSSSLNTTGFTRFLCIKNRSLLNQITGLDLSINDYLHNPVFDLNYV